MADASSSSTASAAALSHRTLVLRIVDKSMQTSLRTYIKEAYVASTNPQSYSSSSSSTSNNYTAAAAPGSTSVSFLKDGSVYAHVAPHPNEDSTFWHFYMPHSLPLPPSRSVTPLNQDMDVEIQGDPKTTTKKFYARLVNLPTLVEVHKTTTFKDYTKAVEIGQMIIVYPSEASMLSAEKKKGYNLADFPGYFHSGLSKATERIVERRFKMRREKGERYYPKQEVSAVEEEIKMIIKERFGADLSGAVGGKGSRKKKVAAAFVEKPSSVLDDGTIEEILEEVVDYEPWMDDFGRVLGGIEFGEETILAKNHPEIWLTAADIAEAERVEKVKEMERLRAIKQQQAGSAPLPPLPQRQQQQQQGLPAQKDPIAHLEINDDEDVLFDLEMNFADDTMFNK